MNVRKRCGFMIAARKPASTEQGVTASLTGSGYHVDFEAERAMGNQR
jgi:hypothetical protein